MIEDMLIELSEFCPLAERMVTAGLSDLDALIPSAGIGIVKSSRSPRLRQRANRKKIVVFFVAVSMIALAWSRSGGVIDHTPHHVPATSWAKTLLFRKWSEASRVDPFSLRDDKRGGMRDFVNAVTSDVTTLEPSELLEPLRFYKPSGTPGRRGPGYEGPEASASSMVQPFLAARLSIPKRAAQIPIDDSLHESTRELWNNPDPEDQSGEAVRGYFPVSMPEWRASLRKMLRAGLATTLPSNTRDPSLAAGAFTVRKDVDKDRLIADRRPENSKERQVGLCLLPYGPRLRRVQLKPGEFLRTTVQDLHNMYYMFKVSDDRLRRQIVGPRVPISWFADIADESLDFLGDSEPVEPWNWSDVRPSSKRDTPWNPGAGEVPGMCQVALTAALMGVSNPKS